MPEFKCSACRDTGVYETGNNDFPCSCKAGATAKFNVCGESEPQTGAQLRAKQPQPYTDDLIRAERQRASNTIVIEPDAPALMAQRLVQRLVRDGLLEQPTGRRTRAIQQHNDMVTEALADAIHQDTIDGTLRKHG